MTIKYVLLVNKQGQTRLARYAVPLPPLAERVALEGEVVRKCLARSDKLVREKRERKERARVRAGGGGRRHARAHVRTPWPPRARVPDTLGLPPSRGDGVPKAGQGSRGTGVHACRSVPIFCCLPRAQPLSPLALSLSSLPRPSPQCSFIEHRGHKIVYRRYASLFFLVGVDEEEVRNKGESAVTSAGALFFFHPGAQAHTQTSLTRSRLPPTPPPRPPTRTSSPPWNSSTPSWKPWTATSGRSASWT